ncbi:MAG: heme lyase subunit CcmF [Rickettsiaceae bacterium]|jgi:cytochrome c-type biogenesis protein CcmF|nr:heme lyase subunit CcmF [Rickettsiaceae bacterium]
MINSIGSLLLSLSTIFSATAGIYCIVAPRKIRDIHYLSLYLINAAIIASFLLLVLGFVISDFSIANVYINSSTQKPLIYKVSAAWASHEGSMLLWMSLLSIMTILLTLDTIKLEKGDLKCISNRALGVQSLLIAAFLGFILLSSNPFAPIDETITEGRGLNPLLQDIGLAIHPPILYLGYVSYSIPFSLIISLLIYASKTHSLGSEEEEKKLLQSFLRYSKKYSLIGWIALSSGVALGSWWAYRVLGWGGFWFFDPVENISLMPWLAGTAFHHSIFATIKRSALTASTLLLGISTFLLCFLGTFLVRSGIITSVHSFAVDTYRGSVILALFGVFTTISLGLFATQAHKFNSNKITNYMTREGGIQLGNLSLISSLIVLLAGTFYPLIIELTEGKKLVLENEFYIGLFIPSLLPSIALSAFLGFSAWNINDNKRLLKKSIIHLSMSLLCVIYYYIHYPSLLGAVCLFTGIYTSIYCLYELFDKRKTASIGRISMTIAHLGIGLIVCSLTVYASFEDEVEITGNINITHSFKGFNIIYRNTHYSTGPNYYRQIAKIGIEDDAGNEVTVLTPELRFYTIEKSMVSSPSIYSNVFYDLYAIITQINDGQLKAKIYYRPAASLFLLSCFIMVSGGLISLLCKRPKPTVKSKVA